MPLVNGGIVSSSAMIGTRRVVSDSMAGGSYLLSNGGISVENTPVISRKRLPLPPTSISTKTPPSSNGEKNSSSLYSSPVPQSLSDISTPNGTKTDSFEDQEELGLRQGQQQQQQTVEPPPPPPSTPTKSPKYKSKRKNRYVRASEAGDDTLLPTIAAPSATTRSLGDTTSSSRSYTVRAVEKGKDYLLPTRRTVSPVNGMDTRKAITAKLLRTGSPKQRQPKQMLRAAESGSESLLPMISDNSYSHRSGSLTSLNYRNNNNNNFAARARFNSSPALRVTNANASAGGSSVGDHSADGDQELDGSRRNDASLRQRMRMLDENYASGDESTVGGPSPTIASCRSRNRKRRDWYDHLESPYRSSPKSPHWNNSGSHTMYDKFLSMSLGNLFKMVTILLFLFMVWDANRKSSYTSQKLSLFKNEEAVFMLHLHGLEKHLLFLYENLERLSAGTGNTLQQPREDGTAAVAAAAAAAGDASGTGATPADGAPTIDIPLVTEQKQLLTQMLEELNHEVHSLQTQIQKSARRSIVQEYGEGPIQVTVDLLFEGHRGDTDIRQIGILLWHDTPHAAWTWLEQITKTIWDGATFKLDNSRILSAEPTQTKVQMDTSRIRFVEQGERGHKAWTVGLMENPQGALRFFINLQDNTSFSRYNVCVGKIINGFDTLQRLVDTTAKVEAGSKPVSIISAKASHLTRRDTESLYM